MRNFKLIFKGLYLLLKVHILRKRVRTLNQSALERLDLLHEIRDLYLEKLYYLRAQAARRNSPADFSQCVESAHDGHFPPKKSGIRAVSGC